MIERENVIRNYGTIQKCQFRVETNKYNEESFRDG